MTSKREALGSYKVYLLTTFEVANYSLKTPIRLLYVKTAANIQTVC